MPTPAGSYISQTDLENRISAATVRELFDDNLDGTADAVPVQDVIDQAEAEVNSYLSRAYPDLTLPVVQSPMPKVLVTASLMFAVPFSFLRHPEYVRTFGENPRGQSMLDQAHAFMERLCSGKQFLFGVTAESKPSTVGGTFTDPGPRIWQDANGVYTGGDF